MKATRDWKFIAAAWFLYGLFAVPGAYAVVVFLNLPSETPQRRAVFACGAAASLLGGSLLLLPVAIKATRRRDLL